MGTPPQDYDDSYCISYMKAQCQKGRESYIITNDRFKDHIDQVRKMVKKQVQDKNKVKSLVNQEI